MIVDTHCHVAANWYEPVETLLQQMERSAVAQAVLIQLIGQFHNDYLLECCRLYPTRFAAVVGIDVGSPQAAQELRKLVNQGARGVRLRPNARSATGDPFQIWQAVSDLGIVVSCVGSSAQFASPEFASLIESCPKAKIVLEHLGGGNRPDASDLERADRLRAFDLARFPNVFLKLPGLGELIARSAALPGIGAPWQASLPNTLRVALELFGPERLMWGSDFPVVSSREGYSNALRWCQEALHHLSGAEQALIFGGTARSFFGLP
jgi:L-fuconolactonase